jgi:aspartate racemase|tara:strand:- start:106 stop:789 length:684 start_codon:yes stop_codon:yes gene_type:complete
MSKYKTIGILGGMGPEATAGLYLRIIQLFQQKYGAIYDSDFPEIIIVNLPIPDVVENADEQNLVKEMLIQGVSKLEKAGADFVAIPCNTVTYYIKEMQSTVSIPIINLLQETANAVKKSGVKQVGLLGTETTIKSKIYDKVLDGLQILTLEKPEQTETTKIIMNILAGRKNPEDRKKLLGLIQKLRNNGAKKVILGCTELPLLIKANDDVFDTLETLAKSVIERATQ